MAGEIQCPNRSILATLVKDVPKECLFPSNSVVRGVQQAAHWVLDQYRAVSPETKQLIAESAFRAIGGPFASACLIILKK